jgi:hypothetical protein
MPRPVLEPVCAFASRNALFGGPPPAARPYIFECQFDLPMHPRVCLLVYLFLAQSAADVQSWDDLAGTIANASKTSQTIVIQLSKRFTMPRLKDFSPLKITNELNVTLLLDTQKRTLGYQKTELITPPPFLFEIDAGTTLCLRGFRTTLYGPVSKLRNGSTLLISDCTVTQSLVVSSVRMHSM